MIKKKIYKQLQSNILARIKTAKQLMDSHKESLQSDTKSTAGDKHETGRAMIQMEYESSVKQWKTAIDTQTALNRIDPSINNTSEIGLGSLVVTNQGNYYLAASLGKVAVDNQEYFVISFASPIGKLLRGKKTGDRFEFLNKAYEILSIT